jgi:[ribosomal protein S18]-alanine N-acetyltransferase
MAIGVSRLTVRDIPEVLEISVECGLCLWSADAYRAELIREDSIMIKISDPDGPPLGFAVGRIFDFGNNEFTVELTNIGLRQTIRRQGFGSVLLKSFLNQCSSAGVAYVILEVRVSNRPAIAFYEKFGFVQTGRRRGFYSDPLEDALTMRLQLRESRVQNIHT